jgi:hypothetical protein
MRNQRWARWALHAAGPPLPITCQPGEVAVVANPHAGSTWFELDDQFIVR